jgi:hypothetical protein
MDTFKEKAMFDELYAKGQIPWAVWETQDTVPDAVPDTGSNAGSNGRVHTRQIRRNGEEVWLDRSNLVARYRRPAQVYVK